MFDEKSLSVFKRLVESFGPSGFEYETIRIIKEYLEPYADEIVSDKLGTVAYVKHGTAKKPRVLLAGHIDEIGFVVSGIDQKTGFLTFKPLGGWWDQVLLGQRVITRTSKGNLLGVIAAKPPHLLPEEERKKVVEKNNMYIDIGVSSYDEAEKAGVKIGDPIVPWSPLSIIHEGKIAMGKAFDDRVGAFAIMEAIRRIQENKTIHPNTIFGAATVQEEVGLRGARTIAHVVDPDVAFVLEVDIAGDVPSIKPIDAPTKMGKGPTLLTFDRSMIPNQPLKEFVIETAKDANIPLQLSHVYRGATD
ncbi:MAG: M42 family metallopeptidase, partial [Candidatus Bathyarchaeota archaeon]